MTKIETLLKKTSADANILFGNLIKQHPKQESLEKQSFAKEGTTAKPITKAEAALFSLFNDLVDELNKVIDKGVIDEIQEVIVKIHLIMFVHARTLQIIHHQVLTLPEEEQKNAFTAFVESQGDHYILYLKSKEKGVDDEIQMFDTHVPAMIIFTHAMRDFLGKHW